MQLLCVGLLALLGTASASDASQRRIMQEGTSESITGEIQRFTTHVPLPLDGDSYFLQYQQGQQEMLSRLLFKNKPANLITGDRVNVTIRKPTAQLRRLADSSAAVASAPQEEVLAVDDFFVVAENPKKDFDYTNGAYNITSVTYLITVCGKRAIQDVGAFQNRWLNQWNPTASKGRVHGTLENYFKECSQGQTRFGSGGDNIVVDLQDVDAGCQGYWGWQPWSATKCDTAEIRGWMQWAQKYALQHRGIDYTKYSRWILIVEGSPCAWDGLAAVGCAANCMVWLKGPNVMTKFSAAFHELGHTLGLNHASTPDSQYGDGSSVMGGCCGDRCFNAPQAWQTAWASPIKLLTAQNMAAGVLYNIDIPVLAVTKVNHVQIQPTWVGGMTSPAFFFSYKMPFEWDATVLPQYINGLSVHIFNGSQQQGPWKSELQGVLDIGSDFRRDDLNFVARMIKKNATHATAQFCRYTAKRETNCNDGLDDDCNGLIDGADPACKGKVPPTKCVVDGVCKAPFETALNCPQDCKARCGDGQCTGTESAAGCPADCPAVCGDCFCDTKRGEDAASCPHDCPPVCGDGFCEYSRGENAANCPNTKGKGIPIKGDCEVVCGDGVCDSTRAPYESVVSCPQDCNPVCGDGVCSRAQGENSENCMKDCKVVCGDRSLRRLDEVLLSGAGEEAVPRMLSVTEALADPILQPKCGDGYCHFSESAKTCPYDCPAKCGDGLCDKYRKETTFNCPADCPRERCGDGVCGASETEDTCAPDCCPSGKCGDGICQSYMGENCITCPEDCFGSGNDTEVCCGAYISCEPDQCNSGGFKCVQGCTPNSEV